MDYLLSWLESNKTERCKMVNMPESNTSFLSFYSLPSYSKWLFKLFNEEGVWQDLLKNKYLYWKSLSSLRVNQGAPRFMKVKSTFLCFDTFEVNDGSQTCFWEDIWIVGKPLKVQYPILHNVARNRDAQVANVMGTIPEHWVPEGPDWTKFVAWQNLIESKSRCVPMEFAHIWYFFRLAWCPQHWWGLSICHTKIWKLKISLKIRFLCGTFVEGGGFLQRKT